MGKASFVILMESLSADRPKGALSAYPARPHLLGGSSRISEDLRNYFFGRQEDGRLS